MIFDLAEEERHVIEDLHARIAVAREFGAWVRANYPGQPLAFSDKHGLWWKQHLRRTDPVPTLEEMKRMWKSELALALTKINT